MTGGGVGLAGVHCTSDEVILDDVNKSKLSAALPRRQTRQLAEGFMPTTWKTVKCERYGCSDLVETKFASESF